MCAGNFAVDVPVNTTQTSQVTPYTTGIGNTYNVPGNYVQTPTPITVEGSLNVSGMDAIYIPSYSGTINSITNTGSITAPTAGFYGINNQGSITTLTNSQGGNSSTPATTALTYTGNLPTNYNVIINSYTNYGQLALTNPTGTAFNFSIDPSSTVTAHTYSDVLQGLSTINNVTGSTGTIDSGAYTYSLQFDAGKGAANDWNLVVAAAGGGSGGAAPEMNASLIPQVGLLLGSLFFLMGRKKESTEVALTA